MPSVRRLAVTTLGIETLDLLQRQDVFDQAVGRKTRHLAEDEDGGTLEAEAVGVGGTPGDGREYPALIIAACVLNGDHGKRGAEARLEQLLGDRACGRDAHIDEPRGPAARGRGKAGVVRGGGL